MPWYTKASLPAARYWAAGYSISGIGYVVAGNSGSGAVRTNYAYNPASDTWTARAQLPAQAARYALAGFAILGIGYIAGGNSGSGATSTVNAYDPVGNSWSTKASMPTARWALAGFAVSNIGYAVGGTASAGVTAANEAYNPSTNTWATKRPMPTARTGLCAFVIGDIGYAVGGSDSGVGGIPIAVNEAYDPVTDTWSTKAPKPTAVIHACAFVLSNLVYVVSGTVNEAYEPVTNTWFAKESPPSGTARRYAAAFVISDVGYMAGGSGASTVYSTVEAFIPSATQDAAAQVRGASALSLQTQRRRDATSPFIGRSACSAFTQRTLGATVYAGGRSSCSASIRGISAIATQIAGSSAIFGQTIAPIDVGARSVGSSTFSALSQYSIALAAQFAGSSAIAGRPVVPIDVSTRSAGSSTFSASLKYSATLAIQVAGSSTVFGRPTAPVDASARSVGASTFSAVTRYSATFVTHVTTSSSCLVDTRRFGTIKLTAIAGVATISPLLSVAFGVSGRSTGSSACSARLQRDRLVAVLTRGATGAVSNGQIAGQAQAQVAGASAFSNHLQITSVLWAQSSGRTACTTGLQLACNTEALSTGGSTWTAYVRRASAGRAETVSVSSCSAALSRATVAWPAIVVGSSLLLLRVAGPVRISATTRGTTAPVLRVAIRQPVALAIGGDTMVIAAGSFLGLEDGAYPGWPIRLDSLAGDLVVTFPTYAMEWETGGDLRTAFADAPLADYAFDLLGTRPAPRGATDESIRFVIVGQDAQDAWQQYMDMRSKLARIGRGRLWVRDALGNLYWAYVRPMRLATTTFGVENLRHFAVSLTFRRLSDWKARTVSSVTLPGNGTHFVHVSGNLPVKDLTIEIAATVANGYASPTIENLVTGERVTVNRVASSDQHRLRILAGRWVALESSNRGMTWSDVTPALTVGSFQATVLRLEPTANILSVSGCPGATITISWYDTYA